MKKRKFSTPSLKFGFSVGSLKLPKFWTFRVPIGGGIYMGGGKLIVGSLSAVALGFLASLFLLVSTGEQQIQFPMLGASYEAPSMVGHTIVDAEFPSDRSQTLQINIPANVRIEEILLSNIDLGKDGLTTTFQLTGTSTSDVITVDELIIRNSEFPTMDFANSDIYEIVATSSVEVAGHTFEPTISTTTNDVVVGSGRGSASYVAKDMVVDRIIITQSTTGGDVIVDKIILDGVRSFVGAADFDYLEIGLLKLESVKIGDDGDIDSADLLIHDSVNTTSVQDGVQEKPIWIR